MDWASIHSYRARLAANSVARALALSLAVHLVLFGMLELSYFLHLHLPDWLRSVLDLSRRVEPRRPPPGKARRHKTEGRGEAEAPAHNPGSAVAEGTDSRPKNETRGRRQTARNNYSRLRCQADSIWRL